MFNVLNTKVKANNGLEAVALLVIVLVLSIAINSFTFMVLWGAGSQHFDGVSTLSFTQSMWIVIGLAYVKGLLSSKAKSN